MRLTSIKNTIKHNIRRFDKNYSEEYKIKKLPRFTQAEISFLGRRIRMADNASFFFTRRELFDLQIYKFISATNSPYIIDCGANIGLSLIYFKELYPDAEIIAFEPDEKIFDILTYNIEVFNYSKIELNRKACWSKETTLQFFSEGADAGRAAQKFDKKNITEVQTIRLRNFLNRKVDFLKMDIEGAEFEVLEDIKDLLPNVERIFVEYHSFSGQEQKLPELLNILKTAGFRLNIHHQAAVHSPQPFVSIVEYYYMDLQLNIFGYRV
ncbi:MAG TPA: FkbM family methyltransferase [Flavisolibacter sp.]|jgi:FkbM family methyltransferase|nr:FkbM family methyltransferase [Flavisolibacter sp.]